MVDYCSLNSNLTVSLKDGEVRRHGGYTPNWTVDLIDTGLYTNTGGRIKRLAPYVNNETFMLTWGDGVSDIDIHQLLAFHKVSWQARNHDRRSPARPIWPFRPTRRPNYRLFGEAADPRGLD